MPVIGGPWALASSESPQSLHERFVEIPGRRALSGRLIVRPVSVVERARVLGSRPAAARLDAQARARLAANIIERAEATDEYVVRVPAGMSDEAYARELLATGDYAYASPDWRLAPARQPDDPLASMQWEHARIHAPEAWELTIGSPSVICAVCDTGVDLTHPDLAPVLVEGGLAVGLGPVVPQSEGGDPSDINGHGTLVAGCLGAVGNNALGVAGCGWDLRIMPVRVSTEPDGTAYLSDINKGARWAAERGARIINCSYEGVSSETVEATGAYVRSLGALLFWAAGNFDQNWTTFDHADVVVVGATDDADAKASFSAFGPGVDLFAPGVGVLTTQLGGGYASADGTSFSSAIAAGVGALIWSRNDTLLPEQVEQILFASCDDLGPLGNDDDWGWGRVNAWEGVLEGEPPESPPGPFSLIAPEDQSVGLTPTPVLQWSESPRAGFYRVLLDDDPTFSSPEIDAMVVAPSLGVAEGELGFDTTYHWTVVAQNLLGTETFLPQVASFTTGPLPVPDPFGVISPAPGAEGVSTEPTLLWEASYRADSYRVTLVDESEPNTPVIAATVAAPQTTLALAEGTLRYSHAYSWSVVASNDAGDRPAPAASFMTAPPPAPASFALLAPVNGTSGVPTGPTLAWTPSAEADDYLVEIDTSPGFPAPVVSVVVQVPDIVAVLQPGTLSPLTVYYWRVQSRNVSGSVLAAPTVSAFTTAAPPAPHCAADINADGATNIYDFVQLALNFGVQGGATREQGDLDRDGAVSIGDFGILAADFGCHD